MLLMTLAVSPPEPTAYTNTNNVTLVANATPCEMAGPPGATTNSFTTEADLETFTCVATFYGPPIGNTISITSGESSIKVVAWVSDTVTTPTGGLGFQFFRLSGSTFTWFGGVTTTFTTSIGS